MDWVEAQEGMELTHDWLTVMEGIDTPEEDVPDNVRAKEAMGDLAGVWKADTVWFLAPNITTRGAWFELGFAVAGRWAKDNLHIIASGPTKQTIFCALCEESETDELAKGRLLELAG